MEAFWWGRWNLEGQAPHESRQLGCPSLHVVFEGDDARIVGPWTRLWRRVLEGRGHVRAVKLHPGAVRLLFPADDAHRFTDRLTALYTRVPDAARLRDRVLASEDPAHGLQHLATWLADRLQRDPEGEAAVALVAQIKRDGITRVEGLATRADRTVRGVQRLFRRNVGVSPKQVIRRFRLQEVALRVEAGEAPDLAWVAMELGYADQAHLARDFRSATGLTLRGFERALDDLPKPAE